MQSRILVVGGDSTIAGSLINKLAERGDIVFHTTRRGTQPSTLFLDLLNVNVFFQNGNAPDVDVVVICAAVSRFADCRDETPQVRRINVEAPAAIARFYSEKNARVILLSTSAVFNGKTPKEKAGALPNAGSGYGKLKAEAENEVLAAGNKTAILRFSKILTPDNDLFYSWYESLLVGKKVKAFTDQFIAPITLSLAIRSLLMVISDEENGIYQFSANGDISYFEAAHQLALYLHVDTALVEKEKAIDKGIPENEISNYNSLDSSRLEKLLGENAPNPIDVLNSCFTSLFPQIEAK